MAGWGLHGAKIQPKKYCFQSDFLTSTFPQKDILKEADIKFGDYKDNKDIKKMWNF